MPPPFCDSNALLQRLTAAGDLRLFLDYDGTLADFAPTPDDIFPDPDLAALIDQLAALPRTEVAIISGRRLSHVQALVPVPRHPAGGHLWNRAALAGRHSNPPRRLVHCSPYSGISEAAVD